MTDRNRALTILKEAKGILSDRLTEKILEQQEDLLADARGDSYMNEIETLYEQVGMKLAHVSSMLSHLPVESPPTQVEPASAQHTTEDAFTVATDPAPSADAFVADTTSAIAGPALTPPPALPAPKTGRGNRRVVATPVSFQLFAAQIQEANIKGAGKTLGLLFGLKPKRALTCAALFAQRLRGDEDFPRQVMRLRRELHAGSYQAALLLLVDCFGLTNEEATSVLLSLRKRLGVE